MITILTALVRLLSADDVKLYIVIISFEVLRGSVVYTLLQYQYIAMLHSSIGIGIGYWYR